MFVAVAVALGVSVAVAVAVRVAVAVAVASSCLSRSALLGQSSYWLGELAFAHEHLERAAALYDPEQPGRLPFAYGLHPAVGALEYDCLALWQLGYPDQALEKAQRGLAIAQKAAHPNSLAMALNHVAIAHI